MLTYYYRPYIVYATMVFSSITECLRNHARDPLVLKKCVIYPAPLFQSDTTAVVKDALPSLLPL